ncbi:MAG: DUF1273 domain-containing protein [Bacillota bacterium]|nr:MAG: DUF1273 domain-containing protein [Bacillota bacterium]
MNNQKKQSVCCFTGNRPKKFPWDYYDKSHVCQTAYLNELTDQILSLISEGFNYFICGGAIGADMDFAEIVLCCKSVFDIQLEIAVPCPNQDDYWQERDKIRYQNILKKADVVKMISPVYSHFCMQKRNRYMADKSDVLLSASNSLHAGGAANTRKYCASKHKRNEHIELLFFAEHPESLLGDIADHIEFGLKEQAKKTKAIQKLKKPR